MPRKAFLLTLICIAFLTAASYALELKSPNEKISVTINPEKVTYSIKVDNKILLLDSAVGLKLSDEIWANTRNKSKSFDETWQPVYGKRSNIRNRFNQYEVTLRTQQSPKSLVNKIVFRAYDDGVAFRYIIDSSDNSVDTATISKELTEFNFAEDLAWWHYQRERAPKGPIPTSEIDGKIDYPLLAENASGKSVALLEAHLRDYPWAVFKSQADQTGLTIDLKKPVEVSLPFSSPWRVIMIGDSTAQLIDSDIVVNLNPKADKKDFAWIKPGISFWDWRAWGYKAPDGFEYDLDFDSWKRFIDFAAETNVPYLLLDANWYGPEFSKDSHPLSGGKSDQVKKAIEYGKEKGVGLILYLNHVAAAKYGTEEILKAYSDWGAAGVKYGFMKINDPLEKVKWTHKVVEMCAKYHLLVNFHDGPVPPTGEEAYLPNFMNREFCHAQSDAKRVSGPADFIKMAHVNMLTGPLDMNHGMFDLVNSYEQRPRMFKQLDSTILAEAARTLITYGGAVTIIPDAADFYSQHSEVFSFISRQNLAWTESKTLSSKMGEYISMMRQDGEVYFVGTVTDESARDLTIDLSFLAAGKKYKASIFSDKPETHYINNRMAYEISYKEVTSDDKIEAHIAPGSGHCMIIEPK